MKIITERRITAFINDLINQEKSIATQEKYSRDLQAFMRWCNCAELTKSLILQYKQFLTEHYAPTSVNSILSSLNRFFIFCNWYELKVKSLKIQKQIFADRDKELTKLEYDRLLSAAYQNKNKRLYYVMQTICSTGIRVSELQFITVDAVKTSRATIACKGKMRTVFLPRQLCHMLNDYIKQQKRKSGPVFVTKNNKPLDRSNIWSEMKNLCHSAGVNARKVFPHNLRHLFARTYYTLQKDIVRLADILGHSSVDTTRIYTMESGEVHCRQIQKLGLLRC